VHILRHRLVSATGLVLMYLSLFAAIGVAQSNPGDFTVVVLPDTQYYSASYPQIFNSQTQWIAANRDALNIQLVIGVGDIVDGPMQATQWQNADAAVRHIDGVVPYVLAIGNHDYDNVAPGLRQVTNFNQWFGPSRYAAYPWYGGNFPDGSNENFYANVNLGGVDHLILALEYIPRQPALDWADGILKANANKPVILVTHSYMYKDNTTIDQCDTSDNTYSTKTNGLDGRTLWRNFVSQYPNVTMVLSGHILGVGQRSDLGVNGNLVNQMLVDYQGWANGGNGYLRIMTFQPLLNQVQVQSYSPYLGKYLTDSANQFVWSLSPSLSLDSSGLLQGRVRRARIGVPTDCATVSGAVVATSSNSTTSDENANYSLGSEAGTQTLSVSDEGFLTTSDNTWVTGGAINDEPLFLYPDQYQQTLCDVSNAPDHSVTFCAPGSATVTSPVRVTTQGKFTQGFINLMQLYVDGVNKAQTTSNQLDTTLTLASGTHSLIAKARDNSGIFFSSTMTISVPAPTVCDVSSAATPSVTICTPANNASVNSPLQVLAQAKDSQPVKRMQLYLDGISKFIVNSDQLNTTLPLTGGSHRISVVSTNLANATNKSTVNVMVPAPALCDTSAAPTPSVTMCSPVANAIVSSPVQVTAQSKDSLPVIRMQLYVDGVSKYTVSSSQLNTSIALASGSRRLSVVSTNSANATSKATLNVTVQ
jgi:hypothetical protein